MEYTWMGNALGRRASIPTVGQGKTHAPRLITRTVQRRGAAILFLLLLLATVSAQPLYLPPASFGRAELSKPEATNTYENLFRDAPAYEPVLDFSRDSMIWRIARPIGRLDILIEHRDGRRIATYCTASLISEDLILTAYHCVPGIDPNFRVLEAQLRMDYLSSSLLGETFSVNIQPLEGKIDFDYSILQVAGNPGRRYGTVALRSRAPQNDEALYLLHHPEGTPKQVTRARCRLHSSPDAVSARELRHRCDSQGGSSGGLLFAERDNQVLGMHWGGYDPSLPDSQRYNVAKRWSSLIAQSSILQQLQQTATSASANGDTVAPTSPSTDTDASTGNTGTAGSTAPAAGDARPAQPPLEEDEGVGRLDIDSSPRGAEVFSGRQLLGTTPLVLDVPAGEYLLQLNLAGYQSRQARVVIAADDVSAGTIPLTPLGQGSLLSPNTRENIVVIIPSNRLEPSAPATDSIAQAPQGFSALPGVMENIPQSSRAPEPVARSFTIDVIARGQRSAWSAGTQSFTAYDAHQFASLWGQAYAGALQMPQAPEVDFAQEMVLAIFAGSQNLGQRLVVESASLNPNNSQLNLALKLESQPGSGLVSSPWLFLKLPQDQAKRVYITLDDRLVTQP